MSQISSKSLPRNYVLTPTPCPVLKFVAMSSPQFKIPPPPVQDSLISFPEKGIMVVTLNRGFSFFFFLIQAFRWEGLEPRLEMQFKDTQLAKYTA